ncbi:hypothetical protein BJV74DRAFT_864262 [Russula compacta]|nr:hypothetical protein BJV74DRAFT_864262 [Russula compacta]
MGALDGEGGGGSVLHAGGDQKNFVDSANVALGRFWNEFYSNHHHHPCIIKIDNGVWAQPHWPKVLGE